MKSVASSVLALALWAAPITAASEGLRSLQDPHGENCTSITEVICDGDYPTDVLCSALQLAGIDDDLETEILTVFAPTNEAFDDIPEEVVDLIMGDPSNDENRELLNILGLHVHPGVALKDTDLKCDGSILMANEEYTVTICEGARVYQMGPGNLVTDYPEIMVKNIEACNGIVHLISEVLLFDDYSNSTDTMAEPSIFDDDAMGPYLNETDDEGVDSMAELSFFDDDVMGPYANETDDEGVDSMAELSFFDDDVMGPYANETDDEGVDSMAELSFFDDDVMGPYANETDDGDDDSIQGDSTIISGSRPSVAFEDFFDQVIDVDVTGTPSSLPSDGPSLEPSFLPSDGPSLEPSGVPSDLPSDGPSLEPSGVPSDLPSDGPSLEPSGVPSDLPSDGPSLEPSGVPSDLPSDGPSLEPSFLPSDGPSLDPSMVPTPTPTTSVNLEFIIPPGEVLCPGLPPAQWCDCSGDCSENPSWCTCAEAQACCEEFVADTASTSEEGPVPCSATEIACDSDEFTYACAALTATGLDDPLNDYNSTFTVFAPSDTAWENLGDVAIAHLFAPENVELLTEIVSFHVVEDEILYSSDLECQERTEMSNGKDSRTVCRKAGVYQKGKGNSDDERPEIVEVDIETCNGVIHVVDEVMLFDTIEELGIPPKDATFAPTEAVSDTAIMSQAPTDAPIDIISDDAISDLLEPAKGVTGGCMNVDQLLCDDPDFSILCDSLELTGLADALGSGNWTVFAPNNQAFLKLPPDTVQTLTNNTSLLSRVLLFHVVADEVLYKDDLPCVAGLNLIEMGNGKESRTLCKNIRPGVPVPKYQKGKANPDEDIPEFLEFDIEACNGVVHELDGVMLYKTIKPPQDDSDSSSDE